VAIVLSHFYRFSHTGRVCAGDLLEIEDSNEGYLIKRGLLIKVFIIFFWVFILALCLTA
jgi:hypothetical protein